MLGKLCPGNNTCNDNGVCDSEYGYCSCNQGYYGDGCESNYLLYLRSYPISALACGWDISKVTSTFAIEIIVN